jgi:hypothetical protein
VAFSTYSNSSTLAKPMNRRSSFLLVTMAVSCVIAFVAWKAFEPSSSAGTAPARQSIMTVGQPAAKPSASGAAKSSVAPPAEKSLRDRFREAKDYARFVAEIAPLASTGNAEAEYLMAKSLKWCAQISRLYFVKPNREVRTLEEVQAIAAARPVGLSQEEIVMIYTRCRGFLEDPELLKTSLTWNQWLDKAVDAGYPAAIAQQALLSESQLLLESHSSLSHRDRGPDAEAQARDLALSAVQSGDPDAIFSMSDWVRTGTRTEEETATLISAWKILACQNGYDCGPGSDWMLSACSWDPQCANGRTYTDVLQRQLGSQYDEAVRLANSISQAIVSKDVQALRSYL